MGGLAIAKVPTKDGYALFCRYVGPFVLIIMALSVLSR